MSSILELPMNSEEFLLGRALNVDSDVPITPEETISTVTER